ncbi:MAG: TonB-dependent receptor, partial [Gemmatimonadetes bacterium]
MLAGVAGAGLVAPARAEDQAANALEEVVVTARKQEEFLQRVPVSVVAITADELQKKSLETLASVGQVTPNFTFSQTGNGGNSSGLVYIRGVGQYDNLSTFDPAVGIYIDGVYLARMQNNDLDMMGIERLEILRGPQGTLFGKNTNGGAINIVTKEPNAAADGLQGRLQLTGGSLNRHDVLAGINIPIVTDKAAVEMSIARRSQDGYGQYADGEEMANRDRDAARLALL